MAMTDWAPSEPTTEETSPMMPSLNLPSLNLNDILQWLERNIPQIPGVTPPLPGTVGLPLSLPETISIIPGILELQKRKEPLNITPDNLFEALGLATPKVTPTRAEFPAEEGLAELIKPTGPEAIVTPKVAAPVPVVPPVEERVPIEAQMPIREPKEGEPPISGMISAPPIPPTIAPPTAAPVPGWKGLPAGLLEGMTPELFNQQLEGILAQRPKTVTELAGPLPEEGKQGPWLVRALQNFGIKLAGGDPDKWRAQQQLRLDTVWTKNLELAMKNMDAKQQTEFMKLNFAIKADEGKRQGAQDFLANAVKNNPEIQKTEGFQRSAMTAWRLPKEAINEWIDSHRDPKTGQLTNLYMSPVEQYTKEAAAKFNTLKTMFPDIDEEKLIATVLTGKWIEFSEDFTKKIGRKLLAAKPEERAGYMKLLAQYEEMTKGKGWEFPNKLETFSSAYRSAVKSGIMTNAQANTDLKNFFREYFIPKTMEAEAKIKEEQIKAAAGGVKAGEEEKRFKLGALKGGDLGVFRFIPGGKSYLAGKTDEAIAQATTFRMILNAYLSGEKINDEEKRMLRTWQAAQVGYLGSPSGLNKGQLYQQIRKLTGTELGPHQLDAVIQMTEQGYPDSEILKLFKPKK